MEDGGFRGGMSLTSSLISHPSSSLLSLYDAAGPVPSSGLSSPGAAPGLLVVVRLPHHEVHGHQLPAGVPPRPGPAETQRLVQLLHLLLVLEHPPAEDHAQVLRRLGRWRAPSQLGLNRGVLPLLPHPLLQLQHRASLREVVRT